MDYALDWNLASVKYYRTKLKEMNYLKRQGSSQKGKWVILTKRDKAIAALNEVDMDGKTLSVSVARPREERPRRSYGNNGGGGYRGGNNSRGGGYGGSRGDNGYGGGRNRY